MVTRSMPKGFGGGEWSNHDVAHPLGIAMLVICGIAILTQPRERVVLPLLFFMLAIPGAQRVVIATLDFSFIRILVMVSLARIFMRGEARHFKLEKPDTMILWWMVWAIIAYGLLKGTSGLITRTGYMLDVVGAYFVGRVYIRSSEDIKRIALILGLIAIPMLVFFFIERATGKNMFSVFGGVRENTMIRHGRLRCQGPFPHPLMAGVFWAGLLPWLGGIWFAKLVPKSQITIFIIAVGFIVANTASSTPVLAVIFGMLGLGMFNLRYKMKMIRRSILFLLFSLHMVMKAPVWQLVARIDISGGSTGDHRFRLIQKSIEHFREWAFIGTHGTAHWGWGMQDMTNQYLLEAVRGGLLGMLLFFFFFLRVYEIIGKALRNTESIAEQWMLWSSGVTLFVHMMSFLAVSYFGQANIAVFLFIGAIVSGAVSQLQPKSMNKSLNNINKPASTASFKKL